MRNQWLKMRRQWRFYIIPFQSGPATVRPSTPKMADDGEKNEKRKIANSFISSSETNSSLMVTSSASPSSLSSMSIEWIQNGHKIRNDLCVSVSYVLPSRHFIRFSMKYNRFQFAISLIYWTHWMRASAPHTIWGTYFHPIRDSWLTMSISIMNETNSKNSLNCCGDFIFFYILWVASYCTREIERNINNNNHWSLIVFVCERSVSVPSPNWIYTRWGYECWFFVSIGRSVGRSVEVIVMNINWNSIGNWNGHDSHNENKQNGYWE